MIKTPNASPNNPSLSQNNPSLPPEHQEILAYVEATLEAADQNRCEGGQFPFRKRTEHILRVYRWAQRLMGGQEPINQEVVLLAALLHDIGYARVQPDTRKHHAAYSAELAEACLVARNYPWPVIEQVTYLVREHSHKRHLADEAASLELITLLEADLLDETGAMSVVWDCMMEGSMPNQSFEAALKHIQRYSQAHLQTNPMRSPCAKALWESKCQLVNAFVDHLHMDLFIEEA